MPQTSRVHELDLLNLDLLNLDLSIYLNQKTKKR